MGAPFLARSLRKKWRFFDRVKSKGRLSPHGFRPAIAVGRAGRQRFPVDMYIRQSLRTEVQVWGTELFGLAKEKISAGFEIEMQALHERGALSAGKVRQHVHTEDAVEAADIDGLGQVHGVEGDQAAQAWLHQQVRAVA